MRHPHLLPSSGLPRNTRRQQENSNADLGPTALTSLGAGWRTGGPSSPAAGPRRLPAAAAASDVVAVAAATAAASPSCELLAAVVSPAAGLLATAKPRFGPTRSLRRSLSMTYSARAWFVGVFIFFRTSIQETNSSSAARRCVQAPTLPRSSVHPRNVSSECSHGFTSRFSEKTQAHAGGGLTHKKRVERVGSFAQNRLLGPTRP